MKTMTLYLYNNWFIGLSPAVSFHHPSFAKIHHWIRKILIFLRSVQRNHGNLALFFEWPTFYPSGFYQRVILLFLSLNEGYQWKEIFVFLQDYDQDGAPYSQSL